MQSKISNSHSVVTVRLSFPTCPSDSTFAAGLTADFLEVKVPEDN